MLVHCRADSRTLLDVLVGVGKVNHQPDAEKQFDIARNIGMGEIGKNVILNEYKFSRTHLKV